MKFEGFFNLFAYPIQGEVTRENIEMFHYQNDLPLFWAFHANETPE